MLANQSLRIILIDDMSDISLSFRELLKNGYIGREFNTLSLVDKYKDFIIWVELS